MASFLRNRGRCLVVVGYFWCSSLAIAANMGAGTANLRAITENGAPLLKPVIWQIFNISTSGKRELTQSFERHSGSLRLRRGQYLAAISFNGRQYESNFEVLPDKEVDVDVTIMDSARSN